ncbi:extracellular superoxide dismutase [Cu-Zn] [Solea senegalensis]|uniref:Superoxide dismutase [Cu-Zn] n=2 Tax=Solea senegalensis TaxID=28829 RepID=A0AAV6Q8R2_SOLSE|nr:extracellular superoxide dismutase [Cu-Zn]-like [Solea senegalensis]KAG7486350.1 extracellular superoxide dismutase [Cu-Zn] [Solea senegalensis]
MQTMRLQRSMCLLEAATLILLAGCYQHISADSVMFAPPEVSLHNNTLYAACRMRPSTLLAEGLPSVYGHVLFKQDYPNGKLNILFWLKGLPTEGDPEPRAVHIHQYGDLSLGCDSTGGHYNPYTVDHPNHPGDFGNLRPEQGKIRTLIESEATLFEGMSVIGRAVVVHEKIDDLGLGGDAGSLLHGNAGRRLSCCVIGISSPRLWDMYYKQYTS